MGSWVRAGLIHGTHVHINSLYFSVKQPYFPFLLSCKKGMKNPNANNVSSNITMWHGVGALEDRYFLSDEMASMCAKYPIYRIEQDRTQDTATTELSHRKC